MVEVITDRLILIPCSLDMAKSLIFYRKELGKRSPIDIPECWPSIELQGYLPFYIERLEKNEDEFGWGVWIIIEQNIRKIIGNIGFKGRPDDEGKIELAYHVVQEFQRRGYGFEAAQSLIEWVMNDTAVKTVTAECEDSNFASIRILEKLGMCCVSRDGQFLKWELKNE
jgi:ribosomal-protein-alanine N-acetyltransferase